MTSLILQPCGDSDANKHFVDTIQNPVDVQRVMKFLSEDEKNRLSTIFTGRKTISVWGVTPGKDGVNIKKWSKIEIGDVALFSKKGGIFASSTVVEKIHNKNLALELWETNARGMTWEYIYFLDELVNQTISYSDFNRSIGYSENYVIQGFNVLDAEKSNRAIDALDLFSQRYYSNVDSAEFERVINLDKLGGVTDTVRKSVARKEQSYLREYLFGKKITGICCLCGEEYPVDLLCASHVKKRSKCSIDERLDYKSIVAAMCLNGCDGIFERGYIVVNDNGEIVAGKRDVSATGLTRKVEQLVGRYCTSWNSRSKKYFAWHKNQFVI